MCVTVKTVETRLAHAYQKLGVGKRAMFGPTSPAGDLTRAIAYYEATLADPDRVLGPDHPDTIQSRNNLARVRRATGSQ